TPKHITFVIDTSSSMAGLKLKQVKEALRHILSSLNPGDSFNVVHYGYGASKLGTMRYSGTAVRKARKYINNLVAGGGTNLDEGLKMALSRHRLPPRTSHFSHHNSVHDGCPLK
ncbi:unnamed protein product, partial [Meganyctiphanes norvegica]